jgi:hypothetical protein
MEKICGTWDGLPTTANQPIRKRREFWVMNQRKSFVMATIRRRSIGVQPANLSR